MDTSYWNNLNKTFKTALTKKQYFGTYLWRLVVEIDCASSSHPSITDIPKEIEHRKFSSQHRYVNFGGNWHAHRPPKSYDDVNIDLLKNLQKIRATESDVKVRIEEPWIQFYANSEDELKKIVSQLKNNECIRELTYPESGTEELLSSGAIITNSDNERIQHKYKVFLRDGVYEVRDKKRILTLLESQGDEIKISKGTRYALNKDYRGLWNGFFYTNDLSITTMISLICPTIVRKIHEVVRL